MDAQQYIDILDDSIEEIVNNLNLHTRANILKAYKREKIITSLEQWPGNGPDANPI